MAFHKIRAYFTGYEYVPDPQPGPMKEPGMAAQDDIQSIVETIVREKAEQAPEDQLSTAEGDTTFADLMERGQDREGVPPLPLTLDGGQQVDRLMPQDDMVGRLGEEPELSDDEGQEKDKEREPWLGDAGPGMDTASPLDRALVGPPQDMDRLGIDDTFGPPLELGGTPADYEDVVDEARGAEPEWNVPDEGDMDIGSPVEEAGDFGEGGDFGGGEDMDDLPDAEDLLPDEEEALEDKGKPAVDRGFLKSILKAEERAAAAARRVLATDVTININIDDGGDVDLEVPPELEEEPLVEEPKFGEEPEFEEPDKEGLGEELTPSKGAGETFDELNDVGDVFAEDRSVGDENDEVEGFGI